MGPERCSSCASAGSGKSKISTDFCVETRRRASHEGEPMRSVLVPVPVVAATSAFAACEFHVGSEPAKAPPAQPAPPAQHAAPPATVTPSHPSTPCKPLGKLHTPTPQA